MDVNAQNTLSCIPCPYFNNGNCSFTTSSLKLRNQWSQSNAISQRRVGVADSFPGDNLPSALILVSCGFQHLSTIPWTSETNRNDVLWTSTNNFRRMYERDQNIVESLFLNHLKTIGCLKCINASSMKQRWLLDIVRYLFLPHLFGKPNPQKICVFEGVLRAEVYGVYGEGCRVESHGKFDSLFGPCLI